MSNIVNKEELCALHESGQLEEADVRLRFKVLDMSRESFEEFIGLFSNVFEYEIGHRDTPNIPLFHAFEIKARYCVNQTFKKTEVHLTYISDFDDKERRLIASPTHKTTNNSERLYIIDGLIGIARYERSLDPHGQNRVEMIRTKVKKNAEDI